MAPKKNAGKPKGNPPKETTTKKNAGTSKRKAETEAGMSDPKRGRGENPSVNNIELLVPVEKRHPGRVSAKYESDIGAFLKSVLTEGALEFVRNSIFGWVLDVPYIEFHPQLIHGLCLKEVLSKHSDVMAFKVGEEVLKFGKAEFAAITSLKFDGSSEKPQFSPEDYRLTETYYPKSEEVSKTVLKENIRNYVFKDDEDAAKMAIVFVIFCFLNIGRYDLTKEDFAIVESRKYVDFPWGAVSFKALLETVKGKLSAHVSAKDFDPEFPFHYHLYGCPQSLMIWMFECCPNAAAMFAVPVEGHGSPRMLQWKSKHLGRTSLNRVEAQIFHFPEVEVRNLVPTRTELEGFEDLVVREFRDRDKINNFSKNTSDSAEDVIGPIVEDRIKELEARVSRIPVVEAELFKLKNENAALSKRMDDMATLIQELLAGKKEEIRKDVAGAVPADDNDGKVMHNEDESNSISDQESDEVETLNPQQEEVTESLLDLGGEEVQANEDFGVQDGGAHESGEALEVPVEEAHEKPSETVNDVEGVEKKDGDLSMADVVAIAADAAGASFPDAKFIAQKLAQFSTPTVEESVEQNRGEVAAPVDISSAQGSGDADITEPAPTVEIGRPQLRDPAINNIRYRFIKSFGKIGEITGTGSDGKTRIVKGGYPLDFKLECGEDYLPLQAAYNNVMEDESFRIRDREELTQKDLLKPVYTQEGNKLEYKLDFKVCSISNKMWFFDLMYPRRELNETHIDVFFYYLRKMANDGTLRRNITTTNVKFDAALSVLFKSVGDLTDRKAQMNAYQVLAEEENPICNAIVGVGIEAAKPWSKVDHVLFPVYTKEHWILLRLDVKARTLYLYDSLRSAEHDENTAEHIRRYSEFLPFFAKEACLWKVGKKTAGNQNPFKESTPLQVNWVKDLPSEVDGDCGAWVIAFAEFFSQSLIYLLNKEFELEPYRQRVAVLLYHYGMMKHENCIESDDEDSQPQKKNPKNRRCRTNPVNLKDLP